MPAVLKMYFRLDHAEPRLDRGPRRGIGYSCRNADRGGTTNGNTRKKRAQPLFRRGDGGVIHELATDDASAPDRGAQTDSALEAEVRMTIAVERNAYAGANDRASPEASRVVVRIVYRRLSVRCSVGWQGR